MTDQEKNTMFYEFADDQINGRFLMTIGAFKKALDKALPIRSVVIASHSDGNIESADYCIGDYDDESDKK